MKMTQNPSLILPSSNIKMTEQGNVLFFILLAIVLFAALSIIFADQTRTGNTQAINEEQARLVAEELMSKTTIIANAFELMNAGGTEVHNSLSAPRTNELFLTTPDQAAFNTAPHYHKLYHPSGGGIAYEPALPPQAQGDGTPQWVLKKNSNVGWTPSSTNDLLLIAYHVSESVCRAANRAVTGNETVPATALSHDNYFLPAATAAFDAAACPSCDNRPLLCVTNPAGDRYSLYSLIAVL